MRILNGPATVCGFCVTEVIRSRDRFCTGRYCLWRDADSILAIAGSAACEKVWRPFCRESGNLLDVKDETSGEGTASHEE